MRTACSEDSAYKLKFVASVHELVSAERNLHDEHVPATSRNARLEQAHNEWCKCWKDWRIHRSSCPACCRVFG